MIGWVGGLAYASVQAIAFVGAVLFVGVRFLFLRAGSGVVGRCTGGEGEIETGSRSEKREVTVKA